MSDKYNLDQTIYDLPVGMLLVGLGLMYWSFRVISNARQAKGWSSVMGILRSKQVTAPDPDEERDPDRKRMVFRYGVEVRYSYVVDQMTYEGSALERGFGEAFYSQAQAEKRIAKYVVGQPVEVFYNPRKPQKSVLEGKLSMLGYVAAGLLFALGVLFFVLGAGGLLVI